MLSPLILEDPRIPILPKRICNGANKSVEVSLGSTPLLVAFGSLPFLQDTPIVWLLNVQLKILSANVPHFPSCQKLEQDMGGIIFLPLEDKQSKGRCLWCELRADAGRFREARTQAHPRVTCSLRCCFVTRGEWLSPSEN
jgi:hypothetical protein